MDVFPDRYATVPDAIAFPTDYNIEGARRQLIGAIRSRGNTDAIISPIWAMMPMIVLIVGTLLGMILIIVELGRSGLLLGIGTASPSEVLDAMLGGIVFSLITSLIAAILFAILTHRLVERQNEHYEREAHLMMGVMSFLRASAGSPQRETMIAEELAVINNLYNQAKIEEQNHSPILWAVVIALSLFILGVFGVILMFYMFYFLTVTMCKHDRRWMTFVAQTRSAFAKLGYRPFSPCWARPLPDRSFGIYLVLSILTLGLFIIYWWYILGSDPNEHFREQWNFEDQIIEVIRQ